MYLDIIEVSQKQTYIFSSNKLKENVERSAEIAWVTCSSYFQMVCKDLYEEDRNLVYAGGGHTVLCFEDESKAISFNRVFTRTVLEDYPNMEVFVNVILYDDEKTASENLKSLTRALEEKKALRKMSFHQGTVGFEEIDRNTFSPVWVNSDKAGDEQMAYAQEKTERNLIPDGYRNVYQFEDLGGDKGESNFVAVVHIDGNGMGARVSRLYEKLENQKLEWEVFKKKIRDFSEGIDKDFKDAYREMLCEVVNSEVMGKLSLKENNLPIRRIIISGDDVCFVSEGRIGIEAARIYIEKLRFKKNPVDGESYAACAGIAIVHVKYPFFRAYELAEALCSNAKREGARLSPGDNGSSMSMIDWHVAFGELRDSVEEEREAYLSVNEDKLYARPYIISGNDVEGKGYSYLKFKEIVRKVMLEEESAARSRIKSLRNVLKQSEEELVFFKKFYHLDNLFKEGKGVLFDAIEVMDTFLEIK